MSAVDVVTGAFSYTGRFVAPRLLARGRAVRTLTNHPDPTSPLAGRIEIVPLDFSRPAGLIEALRGTDTLTTPTGSAPITAQPASPKRCATPAC